MKEQAGIDYKQTIKNELNHCWEEEDGDTYLNPEKAVIAINDLMNRLDKSQPGIKEIADKLYKAYGTDSGIVFGISDRSITETIIKFALENLNELDESQSAPVENIAMQGDFKKEQVYPMPDVDFKTKAEVELSTIARTRHFDFTLPSEYALGWRQCIDWIEKEYAAQPKQK